jgi:long-chain fatty acid transport protein
MVLPIHGVRSLSRAGAFTAGATDADALWQNPAGLAHVAGDGKRSLLFDLALVYQPVEITAEDGTIVNNEQPTQPVPTLAATLGIGDKLVIAGGIAAPYQALHRYPKDSAARFASVSWTGSAFVVAAAGVAYRVNDTLRVGATVQNVFTKTAWSLVASGCPGAGCTDNDDRSFDLPMVIEQTDYLSPSGSIGVQWDPSPFATVGLALQGPAKVAADGTLTAKVPSNLVYNNGRITGDAASVSYWLPPAVRAGVEVHPAPNVKIEAALDVELWSMHDEITIDIDDIAIDQVAGGPYAFRDLTIARNFKTSYAIALGAEYHLPSITLAGGYAYETAAVPPSMVSALTVDAAKHLVTIGGGYDDDGWQVGAALAYGIVDDVTSPGGVQRLYPLGDGVAAPATRDNAGSYKTSFVVAGLRFARVW